ncbi:hypothetical protein, partial [Desulfamplus magnetovallimortis]|uniref:hypothetical protein n=1 Tax=Desulfamplus magnetovallimortis TaxID=1246637 RepID=UPI0011199D79
MNDSTTKDGTQGHMNIIDCFDRWCEENRNQFLFFPEKFESKKNWNSSYYFQGITKRLQLCINRIGNVEVYAFHEEEDEFWDIIYDFDVHSARNENGYYCKSCLEEYVEYFKTEIDLWINHSFIPLLEWSNEAFTKNKYLCFFEYSKGGSTWCRIHPGKYQGKSEEYLA